MSRSKHRRRRPRFTVLDEIYGFLYQRHISARNVARLREIVEMADPATRPLAELLLEIARIKPAKRRRLNFIAEQDPVLFERMVELLSDPFWDDVLGEGNQRLWHHWKTATATLRFRTHGAGPCWCGSAGAYWHCCGDRDDRFASFHAGEERAREEAKLSRSQLPWYHPESEIDHITRCAYEMYYADPDHPLALVPPEARVDEIVKRRRGRRRS